MTGSRAQPALHKREGARPCKSARRSAKTPPKYNLQHITYTSCVVGRAGAPVHEPTAEPQHTTSYITVWWRPTAHTHNRLCTWNAARLGGLIHQLVVLPLLRTSFCTLHFVR